MFTLFVVRLFVVYIQENCFRVDSQDEEKTKEALHLLSTMKIKFPGKTDQEANKLLEQVSKVI